jgi:hypothetical protein
MDFVKVLIPAYFPFTGVRRMTSASYFTDCLEFLRIEGPGWLNDRNFMLIH